VRRASALSFDPVLDETSVVPLKSGEEEMGNGQDKVYRSLDPIQKKNSTWPTAWGAPRTQASDARIATIVRSTRGRRARRFVARAMLRI
jgi:hypothetical protein